MTLNLSISERTQKDGGGKETANLVWQAGQWFSLKIFSARLLLPLNRSFCKRPETVLLSEAHDKTHKKYPYLVCDKQTFWRPLLSAVQLRKLTANYHTNLNNKSSVYKQRCLLSCQLWHQGNSIDWRAVGQDLILTLTNSPGLEITESAAFALKSANGYAL